ncbi:hypothetical protein PDJAM_G00180680 [Pangasius djambal]|uniref:Uncharacterized protein n=1 Tax=Pangasius djambal TaxID=1691987 RepID=A0ACC5Y3D7_9TELE|nr:hypothetical protein [Pangasius djambal]
MDCLKNCLDCWGWCHLGAVEMVWGSHMGSCTVMAWDYNCCSGFGAAVATSSFVLRTPSVDSG